MPSPPVLAVRVENLQRGHRVWRAQRDAAKRALAVAFAELPLAELWQRVKPRVNAAVSLYLPGF